MRGKENLAIASANTGWNLGYNIERCFDEQKVESERSFLSSIATGV